MTTSFNSLRSSHDKSSNFHMVLQNLKYAVHSLKRPREVFITTSFYKVVVWLASNMRIDFREICKMCDGNMTIWPAMEPKSEWQLVKHLSHQYSPNKIPIKMERWGIPHSTAVMAGNGTLQQKSIMEYRKTFITQPKHKVFC